MSLNLTLNAPLDAAGLIDPWADEAEAALEEWGLLGAGTHIPGAAFVFRSVARDDDWCDNFSRNRNAVEWGLPHNSGFLLTPAPCSFLIAGAAGFTNKTDLNGIATNADVLFNSNLQWTTATQLSINPPYNFRTVAMHEFGHVMGLGHEDTTVTVMNFQYHPSDHLHADDRLGMRSRYPNGPGTETDIGPSIWRSPADCGMTTACWVSSPAAAFVGQTITMDWMQENFGTTDVTFDVGFFLSTDSDVTAADMLLGRSLNAFEFAGSFSKFHRSFPVPLGTAPGTYYLGVCLDYDNVVVESNESNNCVTYPQPLQVLLPPDLVVSSVSSPPASVNAGGRFDVTDTTTNIGAGSVSSGFFTRWRLRSTTVPGSQPVWLNGNHGVGTLGPGPTASHSATIPVTVPANLGAGTYSLEACADYQNLVYESDEANNCRASAGTIQVTRLPDLVVSLLTNPPSSGNAGETFNVTDTTLNSGVGSAGASTTSYRFSTDTTITAADPLLTTTRAVPALGAGSSSNGIVTVTIPASIAAGTYYLGACADHANAVVEYVESNNCRVSSSTIAVTRPNLQVSSVSDPPATANAGASFNVTDTTVNVGTGPATASTTRYRLSTDTAISGGPSLGPMDPLLTGSRSVPTLAANGTSSGTVSVAIPSTIASGTYYLGACADQGFAVAESNEFDNCRASATTIVVTNPAIISDLAIDNVSGAPAVANRGASFTMTDTTINIGSASSGASTTSYRLSTDAIITSADLLVSGPRAVPVLAIGARSTGTLTVTIPATVAVGQYTLAACADDANVLPESNEGNNCRGVAIQIR
jgi:subtilase family serine protease